MDAPGSALAGDRYRLARLVSRARWVSIVFGLVEAAIGEPAPISRAGLLAGLAISALYNLPAGRPERFSRRALERFLLASLVADFLVVGAAVALSANAPTDDGYLLWVLPGLEGALLYQMRGAVGFSVGFLVAFTLTVIERQRYFADATAPGSYLFGAVTMVFVAVFSGAMAAIATASARRANEQADHISEQAHELERLYTEARSAHADLSGFLTTLVHEMRSPLTVIAGYADLLADDGGSPTPMQTKAVAAITQGAHDLNGTIDELLLAARIDAGHLDVEPVEIDLAQCVSQAVQRLTGRAELAGATVAVAQPPERVVAEADPHLVERILDNLLTNALNYSGERPAIEVSVGSDDEGWIRIRDHGIGIPEEMRERVFERFVRVRQQTSHPGTGLGLYLSRGLAERLHGSLRLEDSLPGAGTTMVLRLPLTSGSPASDPRA